MCGLRAEFDSHENIKYANANPDIDNIYQNFS
jgi:hypothetical protein